MQKEMGVGRCWVTQREWGRHRRWEWHCHRLLPRLRQMHWLC